MTTSPLTCEQVDALLSAYLEGTLAAAELAAVEAHVRACDQCRELLDGLGAIQTAAGSLATLRPPHDLWPAIERRITTPAIPLARAARPLSFRWPSAVAAAVLVMATAWVTHELTLHGHAPVRVAANDSSALAARTPEASERLAPRPGAGESRRTPNASPRTTTPPPRTSVAPRLVAANRRPADAVYDEAIDKLRVIVTERRAQLDPATVAVLERSLAVIDSAIAQSQAALARDPASRFLRQQRDDALDKKVQLLRTAALLPART